MTGDLIEELLERWEDEFELGRDLSPEELCPEGPSELLSELGRRIGNLRKIGPIIDWTLDHEGRSGSLLKFEPGQNVPGQDYILVERLGAGSFGEVWKAANPRTAKFAVFKFCLSPAGARSLNNEAELLSRIGRECTHPGFVRLLETHIGSDTPFVAYEYVAGPNLEEYLSAQFDGYRRYWPTEAAEIILGLSEVIALAHRLNPPIVHRDLKPSNILVVDPTSDPLALKIADFGIGGLAQVLADETTETHRGLGRGAAGGTPAYGSPEQMEPGRHPQPSDDVHALGIMWYELLVGRLGAGRPRQINWREELVDCGLDPGQIDLLESCFGPPNDRPRDAGVLARKIQRQFPSMRAIIRDAAIELARMRVISRVEFMEKFGERLWLWKRAARRRIPDGLWLIGYCFDHHLGDEETWNLHVDLITPDRSPTGSAARLRTKVGELTNSFGEVIWYGNNVPEICKDDLRRNWNNLLRMNSRLHRELGRDLHESDTKADSLLLSRTGIDWIAEGDEKPFHKALRAVRKSALSGNHDDQMLLGSWELHGFISGRNETRAAKWLRLAARSGQADAQFFLGWMYYNGLGVAADRVRAIRWLMRSARNGIGEAEFTLGTIYGIEGATDDELSEALKWLARAAKRGHVRAGFEYGFRHEFGVGVKRNDSIAARWYRWAADRNHVEAAYRLALCYAKARGVVSAAAEALSLFRRAADDGSLPALHEYGRRLCYGWNIEQDYIESARRFAWAAERGHAPSQFELGLSYLVGRGVGRDPEEAVACLFSAANSGYAHAQLALGLCLSIGEGVESDHEQARFWLTKAADQFHMLIDDDEVAFPYVLALCYEHGLGVVQDHQTAEHWYGYRKGLTLHRRLAEFGIRGERQRGSVSGAGLVMALLKQEAFGRRFNILDRL